MDLREDICPICHRNLKNSINPIDHGNALSVKCSYCGKYRIQGPALISQLYEKQNMIGKAHEPDLDMSIALRHQSKGSVDPIELTDKNYEKIKESIKIPTDPLEVLDNLMLYCSKKTGRFNVGITIPKIDIPLLYVHDDNEMQAILVMAQELEFIGSYQSDREIYVLSLQVQGWKRIIQLRKLRSESKQVFIAMKFGDPKLDQVYQEAMLTAVEKCGYHPFRIDKEHHNDKICDRIIAEIKQSAFVIADFTGHRGGVYFEAGFALGLGIPVIWTCREDDFENLHFDTRQYNHIKWSRAEDLSIAIMNRINATIS